VAYDRHNVAYHNQDVARMMVFCWTWCVHQGACNRRHTTDFAVDASDAGDGNLEIHVTADGESVPNYVRQERDANFRVTFTPQRPTRHKVNILP